MSVTKAGPPMKASNNFLFTKQLFYETADVEREFVRYTLKDDDHEGYPSIKRLFVDMEDETEYLFAREYFLSWNHYKKLLATKWFKEVIDEAREELRLKLSARNLIELRKKASEGHVAANQYLLEKKWDSPGAGRPSKQKIKEEAMKITQDNSSVDEDFRRLTEGFIR